MAEENVDPRKVQFEALARKAPGVTIISDHALASEECYQDRFNLIYRLGPVLDVVRHPQTRTPMAVAIYGDWGTGKTSAMKWLEELLRLSNDETVAGPRNSIKTVWFDPWKYHTKEDVWRGLIAEVIIETIKVKGATMAAVVDAARRFGIFLGRSFIHVLAGLKLKGKVSAAPEGVGPSAEAEYSLSSIKEVLAEYQEAAHPEAAYLNEFETELSNWIGNTLGADERMVIFIDDLDRCMPDIALEVLEALKLYLNIEKLIFVVGVDRGVIDELVKGYYKRLRLSGEKSQNYLAKMFQVEVQLAPRHIQIQDFLGEQLEKVDYWKGLEEWEQDIFRRAILSLSVHNPREVKRLVNSALMSAAGFVMLPELEDAQEITFSQGLQQYFIRRILEKSQYNMADHLRGETLHRFFAAWSEVVIANHGKAGFSSTVQVPDEMLEGRGGKLEPAKSKVARGDAEDESLQALLGGVLGAYKPILSEGEFRPFLRLLADKDLGELMHIPYPEEESASVMREVSIPLDESDPVLLAIAHAISKEPDQVTEGDYPNVAYLNLMGTEVTNEGLAHLERLTGLQHLDLDGTKVTDAGLAHLKGLTGLQRLYLSSTQVTDEGLAHLKGLTGLQSLGLSSTQVTDVGLAHLKGFTGLQYLYLRNIQVTDAGLAHLKGLTGLQYLYLSSTQVTDAGLAHLKGLTGLQSLGLSSTQVTDAGLAHLKGLTGLQGLDLMGTQVTDAGMAFLEEALPNLSIMR